MPISYQDLVNARTARAAMRDPRYADPEVAARAVQALLGLSEYDTQRLLYAIRADRATISND